FDLEKMARVYERTLKQFPSAREVWLENGRWLSARSGVLVVRILDTKTWPHLHGLRSTRPAPAVARIAGRRSFDLARRRGLPFALGDALFARPGRGLL